MAFKVYNVTLSGATKISATNVYASWVKITAPAAAITVENSAGLVGMNIAGAASDAIVATVDPVNLADIYVKGTDAQVVKVVAVLH